MNSFMIGGKEYGMPLGVLSNGGSFSKKTQMTGGGNNQEGGGCMCNVIDVSVFEKMFSKITNGVFYENTNNKTKRKGSPSSV